MPRKISQEEYESLVDLILAGDIGQHEMARITGLSRPYIRSVAKKLGYQFPRNGIEVNGELAMCTNCGAMFRRSASRLARTRHTFCDDVCQQAYMKGANHPAWKTGSSSRSFSQWVQNLAGYEDWRQEVLKRDNYKCIVSGRNHDLQCHHIMPKAEGISPEKALDISNGITLNREIHEEIHSLIRNGVGYEEAVTQLKLKYAVENKDQKPVEPLS